MTNKNSLKKLHSLETNFEKANQFQTALRSLNDFLKTDSNVEPFLKELNYRPPAFQEWFNSLYVRPDTTNFKDFEDYYGKKKYKKANLNYSEIGRASLGIQAIREYAGKDLDSIKQVAVHLTDKNPDFIDHLKAFYDTFVEPLCNWLSDRLENLENGTVTWGKIQKWCKFTLGLGKDFAINLLANIIAK